ncbi:MAG: response regulator, partial [Acidobacteriota bacterium]
MKKILLVDDDPNLCRVLKYQLSGMGLMVEEVSDGGSAVERCLESNYALIVADVNIPVMVGLSFLQLIKLRHPKIPVIVLSAFSSMENVAAAFRYGADD